MPEPTVRFEATTKPDGAEPTLRLLGSRPYVLIEADAPDRGVLNLNLEVGGGPAYSLDEVIEFVELALCCLRQGKENSE